MTLEKLAAAGFKAGLLRVWRAFRDGRPDTLEKQGALMIFCSLRSGQHYFSLASGENVRKHHGSNLPLSILASSAELPGFVFADFAGEHLPGWQAVEG